MPDEPVPPPGGAEGPPAKSPGRVLVVDDEVDVASSLRSLLVEALPTPVTVRVAGSAEEAERVFAAEQPFDLVLCDYKLPGKTGIEFLRDVRERSPETRRVLITAFADLDVATNAINEANVDTFLEKPFDPDAVVARVTELLDDKRAKDFRQRAFHRALEALRARVGDP